MFTLNIQSSNLALAQNREKSRRRSLKGKRIVTLTEADLKRAEEMSSQLKAFRDAQAEASEKMKDVVICADTSNNTELQAPATKPEKAIETAKAKLQRITDRMQSRNTEKQFSNKGVE